MGPRHGGTVTWRVLAAMCDMVHEEKVRWRTPWCLVGEYHQPWIEDDLEKQREMPRLVSAHIDRGACTRDRTRHFEMEMTM